MGFRNRLNFPPGSITNAMLADGSVTGPKLSFDAIDGKTITGAFIRTAETGVRWEMDSPGFTDQLRGYTSTAVDPGGVFLLNGNAEIRLVQPRLSTTAVASFLSLSNVDNATTIAQLGSDLGGLVNPATGATALTWSTQSGQGKEAWFRDTSWTALTRVNGWVDFAGSRLGYLRDASSNVWLRGVVASGTAALIGTLPFGYRPSQAREFVQRGNTSTSSVMVVVLIDTNGQVTVQTNLSSAQVRLGLDLAFSTI